MATQKHANCNLSNAAISQHSSPFPSLRSHSLEALHLATDHLILAQSVMDDTCITRDAKQKHLNMQSWEEKVAGRWWARKSFELQLIFNIMEWRVKKRDQRVCSMQTPFKTKNKNTDQTQVSLWSAGRVASQNLSSLSRNTWEGVKPCHQAGSILGCKSTGLIDLTGLISTGQAEALSKLAQPPLTTSPTIKSIHTHLPLGLHGWWGWTSNTLAPLAPCH